MSGQWNGWEWVSRAADVVQLAAVPGAVLGAAATFVPSDQEFAEHAKSSAVWIWVGVFALLGLALLVTGAVRRWGATSSFGPDRGRVDTVLLVLGCCVLGPDLLLVFQLL